MTFPRIVTVLGARPQFIKHGPTGKALRAAGIEDIVIHTGQHYDREMSDLFFDELEIPTPQFNLGIGSGSHGRQTAEMLVRLEELFLRLTPRLALVHGDTNSTLAGALAAVKLQIPVAHNEAGMRSFNRSMPEEVNRVVTDHCSDLLFCPTESAAGLLRKEGIEAGIEVVGDVQYDVAIAHREEALARSIIMTRLGLQTGEFILTTLHRPYTVDDPARLGDIVEAFRQIGRKIVFPVHPRTKERLREFKIELPVNVLAIEPLGYLDMIALECSARLILTDSGGVQKEAYYHGVPCATLRPETEWIETVEAGWNRVVDTDIQKIVEATFTDWRPRDKPPIFGDGHAAEKLAGRMVEFLEKR